MSYDVYVHTNTITNKSYVGISKLGMMKRWARHLVRAKSDSRRGKACYFHRAITKYGPNVWTHTLLETVPTLEIAERAEEKWIKQYRSFEREFGYNLTPGGNVSRIFLRPNPFLGKRHTDETKAKLSAAMKGRFVGQNNPYYGRKHTKTVRAKMSAAAKKRCADPNWKAPLQLNPPSAETRRKMGDARRGKPIGRWNKEQLLEACKGCRTQRQVAEKLGCTAANVSYLMKYFDCKNEVRKALEHSL